MKLKYHIINLLDRLSQTCWANLVMWAEGYEGYFRRIFIQECRKGKEGYPYAYCGKCERNGRFNLAKE